MTSNQLAPIERAKSVLSYNETKARLAELASKSERITEITNPAGYKEAQSARVELKNTRVDVQRRGKEAREDATAYSKAVIAAEKELVAVIEPEESRLQALQDAWDAAREAERQEKIRAEQDRIAYIRNRIANIRLAPIRLQWESSSNLRTRLAGLREIETDEGFDELADMAKEAKAEAIATTEAMIADAEQREAEEARRAEEAAAKAEADRIESERLAAERAELDRQRAELDAQKQAVAATQAKAEAAQREAQESQRKAEEDARIAELERQRQADRVAREAAEAQAKAARDAAAAADAARIAAEIAGATIHEAAQEAVDLLTELGKGEHVTTRKLSAAIAKLTS